MTDRWNAPPATVFLLDNRPVAEILTTRDNRRLKETN